MLFALGRNIMLAGLALVAAHNAAVAQRAGDRVDMGKIEYENKCATCHGLAGKGDGPTAPYLTPKPADLSTLAKRNGGVFPVVAAYETVTGERQFPGHGTRQMPTWGEYYAEWPFVMPEAFHRARVLLIVEYIYRLQEK